MLILTTKDKGGLNSKSDKKSLEYTQNPLSNQLVIHVENIWESSKQLYKGVGRCPFYPCILDNTFIGQEDLLRRLL